MRSAYRSATGPVSAWRMRYGDRGKGVRGGPPPSAGAAPCSTRPGGYTARSIFQEPTSGIPHARPTLLQLRRRDTPPAIAMCNSGHSGSVKRLFCGVLALPSDPDGVPQFFLRAGECQATICPFGVQASRCWWVARDSLSTYPEMKCRREGG